MSQVKLNGKIWLENGETRVINNDVITTDQTREIDIVNDYLVRWAMVTGSVVDDWTLTVDKILQR